MNSALISDDQTWESWFDAIGNLAAAETTVRARLGIHRRTRSSESEAKLAEAIRVKQQARNRLRDLMHAIWNY